MKAEKLFISFLIFTIVALLITAVFSIKYFLEESKEQLSQTSKTMQEKKRVSMIFVGDIMLDRGVEYMIKKFNNWQWPFLKIADELKTADIVFGNLESPISDKGIKVGSIYSFQADPKTIDGLILAGFNIMSVANNHAFDYGRQSFEDTLTRLKAAGIDYVGGGFSENETFSPLFKEVNGTKIAFLSYTNLGSQSWKATEERTGIAWVGSEDLEKIKKDIENAKQQSDILVVSFHTGTEYSKTPNQFQTIFYKSLIDAGADFVIGHHSHVVQPVEKYNQGWIAYSLGNFVFDQGFSKETIQGLMLKVLIENKKIKNVIPIDIKINNYFQPESQYY